MARDDGPDPRARQRTVSRAYRLGTRSSPLARAQADLVVRRLRRTHRELSFEIVPMTTAGDRRAAAADFTGTIERALRARQIDLAVHSTKDLPARDTPGLVIAAYPRRADPGECVVARRWPLPSGARVGSSSVRRRAQLRRWRPDLRIWEIHGNVGTRLERVSSKTVDAVVLARAGLERLHETARVTARLPLAHFLPSPGQGALAVQTRREERSLRRALRAIDDRTTRAAVESERAVAEMLGANCNVPLGSLGEVRGGRLSLRAEVLSADGRRTIAAEAIGNPRSPRSVARRVVADLNRGGAQTLLAPYR